MIKIIFLKFGNQIGCNFGVRSMYLYANYRLIDLSNWWSDLFLFQRQLNNMGGATYT